MKSQKGHWTGILKSISTKTQVLALICLVLEIALLTSLTSLPEQQRLYALLICIAVMLVMLIGIFWIEYLEISNSRSKKLENSDNDTLPKELKGNVLVFDPSEWNRNNEAGSLYRTATSMKFAGRYAEAIDFYRRVLRLEQHHWKAKYNIGSCHLYLHEYDKAESIFNALIHELNENDWKSDHMLKQLIRGAYMQLNVICDAQKRFSDGDKYLLLSLEVLPDDALAYANLAISSLKASRCEEAKKWYQILMEHPDRIKVICSIEENDKIKLDSLLKS